MVSYASIETYSFTYRGSEPPPPPPKKKKKSFTYMQGNGSMGFCELGTRALTGKFGLWLTHPHS